MRMEAAEDSAAACNPEGGKPGLSLWVDALFGVAFWFSEITGNLTTPRAGRSRARLLEAQIRIKPANFIMEPLLGCSIGMTGDDGG